MFVAVTEGEGSSPCEEVQGLLMGREQGPSLGNLPGSALKQAVPPGAAGLREKVLQKQSCPSRRQAEGISIVGRQFVPCVLDSTQTVKGIPHPHRVQHFIREQSF